MSLRYIGAWLQDGAFNPLSTPPATDPYFYDVSLLLNGNGTNGAQNNTFLDSSTNNFTIARNGNTTQGSFSPYGNLWSNYFNSGGVYPLTIPQSTNTDLGSGNFTIEAWVYNTSFGSYYNVIGAKWEYPNKEWFLQCTASSINFYLSTDGLNDSATFTASATIPLNTWNHIAVSRSGSSLYIFLNGSLISTQTITQTFYAANIITSIGQFPYNGVADTGMRGYISNFRLVKGTAVYTSSFTPSTTPLTAISGTQILTCQSNRFQDNSPNNFTVTPTNSNNSVQRFSPFNPTSAYSTSVIGGSAYANDNGYLSSTGSLGSIGTGDFTVEGWVYPTTYTYSNIVLNIADDQTSTGISFYTYQNTLRVYSSTGYLSYSGAFNLNSWNHVAWVRQSGVITAYLNGVSVGSGSYANNISSSGFRVGGELNSGTLYNGLQGYMTDVRLVNSAIYTTTFTPPTSPLTAVSGTQLLTNFTNAGISDLAMQNDLQTVGTAQVSTSVVKYGTGSIYTNGSGNYLVGPASPNLQLGGGDFTIEGWVYPTATGSVYNSEIASYGTVSGFVGWHLYQTVTTNHLGFGLNYTSVLIETSTALTLNTWQYITITRSGNNFYAFINGVLSGTATSSEAQNTNASDKLYIGTGSYEQNANRAYTGYIDDLRITKGLARYTATFTPPTAALPTSGASSAYLQYGGLWTTSQATDAVAQNNWAVPPQPHLFAWGTSSAGQLGLGNTASYSSPKQVGSLTNWLVIAAGYGNTAAIKTDGTLWTWGQNNQGQSGLNNTTYYSSPKQVGALTNWSYLASGSYHVAAIKTDGTLWCWGYNSFGQVGNNTSGTSISSPVQIGSLTNWLKVTAGYYHNVAVKTDGTLWSWGWNAYGQLGLGNVAHYSSPKQIGSGTTWSNIACGYAQTFATKTDGTIWSWGYGVYGATGQQTTTNYSSPKQIGALTTWLTPASGRITGYSIKTDGTLWAWGYNGQGNLANGNIANNYSSPIQIGSATNWSKVTGSYYSVYGIKTDGTLYSWGANGQGQLGLGNTTNRSSVNQVGALTSWTTLPTTSAGYFILAIANT